MDVSGNQVGRDCVHVFDVERPKYVLVVVLSSSRAASLEDSAVKQGFETACT